MEQGQENASGEVPQPVVEGIEEKPNVVGTDEQPTVEPTEQPEVESAERPTAEPTEPVEQPVTEPAEPAEQPAAEPAEQPKVESIEPTEQPKAEEPDKATEQKVSKKNKTLVGLLVVLILAIAGVSTWLLIPKTPNEPKNDQTNSETTVEQVSKLTLKGNGLSDFDFSFLKLNNNSENIIYSPLSIKYALGMLADGADENSKTQITNLLGSYQPKAYLNSANLSLANAMFVREESGFSDLIKDSYTSDLKTKYGASVVYDSFKSPNNANKWVGDKTLGIINDVFNEDNFNTEKDFALVNALAIDMEWNNQLQCTEDVRRATYQSDKEGLACKYYSVRYKHEDYLEYINVVWDDDEFSKLLFNNEQEVRVAKIGASANRYDIIKELGEDYIRETVQTEYEKWLPDNKKEDEDYPFNLDEYMEELAANHGKMDESTDFLFYDSESERVFAKDLMNYDGITLEYVGIMPKTEELSSYINNLDAEKVTNIIGNLKVSSSIDNYKDGVVTKVYGSIPFFKYSYDMKGFKNNLKELGVTDVFNEDAADLTNMVDLSETDDNAYIMDASHKADIDFSNNGIKAAAVTVVDGGMGATAGGFDYKWEVPVEEIDLTFDKPFMFIIRDKASGEVWFTGAVYTI